MPCVYLGQSRQAHLLNLSPISSQPPISPKSFPCHTYEKCACKSFACHTYKNKGLKVLCLPHIRKNSRGYPSRQPFRQLSRSFFRAAASPPSRNGTTRPTPSFDQSFRRILKSLRWLRYRPSPIAGNESPHTVCYV